MYDESLVKQDAIDAATTWLILLSSVYPAYAIMLSLQAHRFHLCGLVVG